jgi:uncharacterized protein YjbJ (UPF0337 family)
MSRGIGGSIPSALGARRSALGVRLWLRDRILKGKWQEVRNMNRDELEGKGEQIKGKIKQAVGDLTDNEELEGEGVADEAAGNVQEGFGKARRKVGETIEDVGQKLKR